MEVVEGLARAGGRPLLVGGFVRDRLLGQASKDYDFEVFGLPLERLEEALSHFGEVIAIGRAFGVLKVKGLGKDLEVDFAVPRRDSKVGAGHRGFVVDLDPTLDYATAARRRDLTVNSMAYDPLSEEILDPHGGRRDLAAGVLRATDRERFTDDSLRGLRVAQFRARLEMQPDAELFRLCSGLDLSDLPGERLFEELKKLLLKARQPSLGLAFLEATGLLAIFPELQAMVGVPQEPEWHPEGTVWEHTLLVVDQAAGLRDTELAGEGQDDDALVLMLAALCHDLGKATTTAPGEDGRIRSPGHEEAGVPLTQSLLGRMRVGKDLTAKVAALVRHHLAPALLPAGDATPKAYRRLTRKLAAEGLSGEDLHRLARADHFGRTTADALARQFPAGDRFLSAMRAVAREATVAQDVVQGRHLLERGLAPGPGFGPVLAACRDVQDETGWDDPARILDRVLTNSDLLSR